MIDPGYLILKWWRKLIKPIRPGTRMLSEGGDLLEFHKTTTHALLGALIGTLTALLVLAFSPWYFVICGVYLAVILYEELIIDKGWKLWDMDNTVDFIEKTVGLLLSLIGLL